MSSEWYYDEDYYHPDEPNVIVEEDDEWECEFGEGTPPAGDAPSLTPLPGLRSGSAISAAPSGGLERTGSEDD